MQRILTHTLFTLTLLGFANAWAINDTLIIKRATLVIEGIEYPTKIFQRKGQTDTANAFVLYHLGMEVNLYIENQDNMPHTVEIVEANLSQAIQPGGRALFTISASEKTLMNLQAKDPWQRYFGLGMPIIFRKDKHKIFLWNYRGMQKEWYDEIENTGSPKSEYRPTNFTINNRTYPYTKDDTLSTVKGHVGDSLEIVMYNTSPNYHALHFHGYHAKVLKVTKSPFLLGLEKDTFPIKPGEMILLLVVPDKPGIYHVHDHNLIATTISGNYPGGMMTHLHIMP